MRSPVKLALTALAIAVSTSVGSAAFAQGRGAGPSKEPSATRSVPAETTAAAVVDKSWKAPRTSWGQPSLEGVMEGLDMRFVEIIRAPGLVEGSSQVQDDALFALDQISR